MKGKIKRKIYIILISIIGIFIVSSNVSIVLGNNHNVLTHESLFDHTRTPSSQRIDGLYYMYNIGWAHDMGALLRDEPDDHQVIYCGWWIQFKFDEPGIYPQSQVFNIYYHLWQREPQRTPPLASNEFDLGYDIRWDHQGMDDLAESIHIDTDDYITVVPSQWTKNGVVINSDFRLIQAMQYTDPLIATFDDILELTIKLVGEDTSSGPTVICDSNQSSFVILNLEDNDTLCNLDRDGDCLNDYDECYVYYTNPFDPDTDNDSKSDYEEVNAFEYGFTNSDPNDYRDTTDFSLPDVFFVDDDNTEGPWDGSMAHPYQHIQDGVDAIHVGRTLFICEGVYYEHLTVDKSICIIGEDKNTTIIDGGGDGRVIDISVDGVTVREVTIQNGSHGIYLDSSSYSTISNNIFNNNSCGAYLKSNSWIMQSSNQNIISKNTFINNSHGIYLSGNVMFGVPIENNIIYWNTILNSEYVGIEFRDANYNTISRNTITSNEKGICLHRSDGNIITMNIVSDNSYGIELWYETHNNNVHHNNFIDNVQNAYDESINNWNTQSQGNYWSDYTGVDEDNDNIGDTPYAIPGTIPLVNKDEYPMMTPLSYFPVYPTLLYTDPLISPTIHQIE